jgi:DNA polymerase III epsilon subunit-like protein
MMDGKGVLIVVDTETTDKWPSQARILEAAAVVIKDGAILPEYFSSMSNPGAEAVENTDEARLVNGITKEEIAAAPLEAEVRAKFTEFITRYEGAPLTSYNIHYDRIVLEVSGWIPKDWRWGKCIMMMATEVLGREGQVPFLRWKGEYKWAGLAQAAAFFGVERRTAHRALDDAIMAAEVWLKMTANERGEMIPLGNGGK